MRPFLTAFLLVACSGVPPVVERDAGVDAAIPDAAVADAGRDGGADAGPPDAGPDAGCSGGCGASCAVCGAIQQCEAGACVYFNRIRFSYGFDDGGLVCTGVQRCDIERDFNNARTNGIVDWYRDAGCSSTVTAGDGVTTPDLYRVDCVMPFCRPLNPSSNCCRTFTPGGFVGACGWTPP